MPVVPSVTKLVEVWAAIPYVYDPPLVVLNDCAKATTLPAGLVVVVWLTDWFQDDASLSDHDRVFKVSPAWEAMKWPAPPP